MITDENVCEMIVMMSKIMQQGFHKEASGFVLGERMVMGYLDHNKKSTAGEIAKVSRLGTGRVANILKVLEKKGDIIRSRDEKDKRTVIVEITPLGSEHINAEKHKLFEHSKSFLDKLGETDSIALIGILHKITDGMEAVWSPVESDTDIKSNNNGNKGE